MAFGNLGPMATSSESQHERVPQIVKDDTTCALPPLPPTPRLGPQAYPRRFPAFAEECLYIGISLHTALAADQPSKGTTPSLPPQPTREGPSTTTHTVKFHQLLRPLPLSSQQPSWTPSKSACASTANCNTSMLPSPLRKKPQSGQ
jgi:hypothetical protein